MATQLSLDGTPVAAKAPEKATPANTTQFHRLAASLEMLGNVVLKSLAFRLSSLLGT